MNRLKYNTSIHRPAATVYDIMLGLNNKKTYEDWTSIFSPTSSYEGNWNTNSKMLFTSLDDKGERAGMISKILENRANEFVSIEHYGMLKSGEEITSGPEVDPWAGGLENYQFEEKDGITTVFIEIDAAAEHKGYMDKLYPNALKKLKEVCERE
ncbi:MAG: SRPBCC domain-containing protein [Bacteroidota bacterium]